MNDRLTDNVSYILDAFNLVKLISSAQKNQQSILKKTARKITFPYGRTAKVYYKELPPHKILKTSMATKISMLSHIKQFIIYASLILK